MVPILFQRCRYFGLFVSMKLWSVVILDPFNGVGTFLIALFSWGFTSQLRSPMVDDVVLLYALS